jgi:hypothetical protein
MRYAMDETLEDRLAKVLVGMMNNQEKSQDQHADALRLAEYMTEIFNLLMEDYEAKQRQHALDLAEY